MTEVKTEPVEQDSNSKFDLEDNYNANSESLNEAEIKESRFYEEFNLSSFSEANSSDENMRVKKRKRRRLKRNKISKIQKENILNFLNKLSAPEKLSSSQRDLNHCLSSMHTRTKLVWSNPSVIIKALKDAILKRKWNNVTRLLLMLIDLPTHRYRHLIRHTSQLLDQLHPLVEDMNMTGQFRLVNQVSKYLYLRVLKKEKFSDDC